MTYPPGLGDRDENAKARFLKEAITKTDLGLHAISRVSDQDGYQALINALNSSWSDLAQHRQKRNSSVRPTSSTNYPQTRKSVWGPDPTDKIYHDTLFAGQSRYGRDPRTLKGHHQCIANRRSRKDEPKALTRCFN